MMDFSFGVHYVKNSWISVRYVVGDCYVTLDSIEVIPELRGCGIGTRFMHQFMEESPYSIILVILYSRPLNFYNRLGFKIKSVDAFDNEGNISSATLIYKKECVKDGS